MPDTGHTKSNGKEYKMSGIKAGSKAKKASSAASGSISAITTTAGKKPLSLGQYRSMTSVQRAREKLKASQMERAGQITKAEMELIHKRIDDANEVEAARKAARQSGKKITKADTNPLIEDMEKALGKVKEEGTSVTYKDKEKLQKILKEQEAQAKPKARNKGGVMQKATPFNKGGMSSRKGNFDMRKGGMFAK